MKELFVRYFIQSKLFKTFIITIILLSLPAGQADAEEVREFRALYTINADGTLTVREDIEYDFGPEDRHGIFRTLPVAKKNDEGKSFLLSFSDSDVLDDSGGSVPFDRSQKDGLITLKIGDPDITVSGIRGYSIGYTVSGALTYFSDHDELFWNVTGNGWEVPITRAAAEIVLPSEIPKEGIRARCFTGKQGSKETDCTQKVSDTENNVSVWTNSSLPPGEGLTMVVSFPSGFVSVLEPLPDPSDSLFHRILTAVLIFIAAGVFFVWYIGLPLFIMYAWWKNGRDPVPPMGVTSAWFSPPKGKHSRDLTPAECGVLIDETASIREISATIIDLARRGHLVIEEEKKNDIVLRKVKNGIQDAQEFEKLLFEGMFEKSDILRLKDARLEGAVEKTKQKLYESVVAEGFFPKNPHGQRTKYVILGALAMSTLNFPLGISAFLFGRAMPRKTMNGAQTAAVASSLKNFLASQDKQFEFQANMQMVFEKMLPYAIAFGVETLWARRFSDIELRRPDWYSGPDYRQFSSVSFVRSLDSTLSSVGRAATPTRSGSGFSSGMSSGSSGGGGGGGGGGSW